MNECICWIRVEKTLYLLARGPPVSALIRGADEAEEVWRAGPAGSSAARAAGARREADAHAALHEAVALAEQRGAVGVRGVHGGAATGRPHEPRRAPR